ncbi:MAG TPA: CDP-2,3-bis-(O-geranylgeranyl)-sn-glycerol synthase [Candidatus Thermoplasmatota archaeon]
MTLEATLLGALWVMLPAYLANPAAQVTGGGLPMDFGRSGRDGRRLLGPGKTWRGLAGGCLGGLAVGALQVAAAAAVGDPAALPTFDPGGGAAGPASFLVVGALAVGALLGDATKSWAKRRIGLERGARMPLADQYDFVLGAWLLSFAIFPAWFAASFPVEAVAFILLITFALHRGVSRLGYRMGLKAEPW